MSIKKIVSHQEYEALKAMFKVASFDYSRMAITKVFYSASRDLFFATDGHVLRAESVMWMESEKPDVDCYLDENQVSLNPRMVLERSSPDTFFDHKKVKKSGIEIELRPCSESNLVYPNLESILDFKEPKDIAAIAIDEGTVKRFFSSFAKGRRTHKMEFFGPLAGIKVSTQTRGNHGYKFSGIITPSRIIE